MKTGRLGGFVLGAAMLLACSSSSKGTGITSTAPPLDAGTSTAGLQRLGHVVVIVLENWSFDSLYAEFDGAEGLAGAMRAAPQQDPTTGQPYAALPETESHLPAGLPNTPFALDPYLGVGQDTSIDLTDKFYEEQQQIHGGLMDLFVGVSSAKGLTMGYFHTSGLPLAAEATKKYPRSAITSFTACSEARSKTTSF